jgi:hypothetical protein
MLLLLGVLVEGRLGRELACMYGGGAEQDVLG